ncbi:MAG: VanW family protein [Propionibacteriaceae bacterium]|nr:VanW family protein [Propionibacteriaceae bacterium]
MVKKTGAKKSHKVRNSLFAIGTLAILAGGTYIAGYLVAGDHIPRNTTVAGVPIGGLNPSAAEARLRADLAPRADVPMRVAAGENEVMLEPSAKNQGVDYAATIALAGGGEFSWNPIEIFNTLFSGGVIEPVINWDDAELDRQISILAQDVAVEPKNATLGYVEGKPVVTEGTDGVTLNKVETIGAVKRSYLQNNVVYAVVDVKEPDITTAEAEEASKNFAVPAIADSITVKVGDKGHILIEPELIADSLTFEPAQGVLQPVFSPEVLGEGLARELDGLGLKQPKNASFAIGQKKSDKPKIVPSKEGEGIDTVELADKVKKVVSGKGLRTVEVGVAARPALFTTEDAKAIGVKEITGTFTTYFPGTAYRYNNIGKAAKLVNSTFLMPGETFSMNQTLGERTVKNGWMSGGAIDGGKIVERMGGGISQATTTTFNAIFFAGLEDVYHKPHSLYFSRYPVGREATLDWSSVDMKFKNNSEYGVLMQAWITGKKGSQGSVTVRVWSTKKYTVKSSKPVKSNYRQPGEKVYDTSKECVAQSAMSGFDVRFDRLFYEDGKLVKKEPFKWSYNSLTPVVCGEKPDKGKK